MFVVMNIGLLILNLTLGFFNINIGANPYVIACNFFAAGFSAMATLAIVLR